MYVMKTSKWIGCNSNTHVIIFDKNLAS